MVYHSKSATLCNILWSSRCLQSLDTIWYELKYNQIHMTLSQRSILYIDIGFNFILIAVFWKFCKKKLINWYLHRHVPNMYHDGDKLKAYIAVLEPY